MSDHLCIFVSLQPRWENDHDDQFWLVKYLENLLSIFVWNYPIVKKVRWPVLMETIKFKTSLPSQSDGTTG